jgi:hypothetical protein
MYNTEKMKELNTDEKRSTQCGRMLHGCTYEQHTLKLRTRLKTSKSLNTKSENDGKYSNCLII